MVCMCCRASQMCRALQKIHLLTKIRSERTAAECMAFNQNSVFIACSLCLTHHSMQSVSYTPLPNLNYTHMKLSTINS